MLKHEMIKLTDWHVDDLFQHNEACQIIAPFSRIFCDVERFPEDKDEIMSQYGMGMLYTTFDDGKPMRKITKDLRNRIFKEFYQKHHDIFSQKVAELLKNNGECLIIDCHSFPNTPFERDIDKTLQRPDINIGTDDFHTPKALLDATISYFKDDGFSCKINTPYAGTIVPLEYYMKNKSVRSIMIEVNRDLYLETGSNIKNKKYDKMKLALNNYIGAMMKVS